ncbi:MAG: glycoside hydrolase family 76 protein, partial [Chitinophagaceae bacterium]|nr:glycoside hydrolase family 76 protein [Chitinophagaceae bacterium]
YNEFYPADTVKKKYSYLWPLCGLIQAANETDAALITTNYFDAVLVQIQPYYDDDPPKPGYNSYIVHPAKESRFYDDNQWIGIACMDAYQRTKKDQYLLQGKMVYDFMMTGFDTLSGGGLYWKEKDYSTKNTCSNGPGVLVALQLYKATNNKTSLDTARMLYNWVNKKLLSPARLYYDNIQLPSGKIDKRTFTYNTGTMLQSSVLLYKLTKEIKYLSQAKKIATASLAYFYKNKTFPDNYWFNAVLLRGYLELYKIDRNKKYIAAMQQYGETICQKERDTNELIGKHNRKELLDQAAVMEIFASLAQLSSK